MEPNYFQVVILIARPGAGKSEIIHYLKNVPQAEREQRFHIGELDEIDDFPMLWAWFEEDEILESMGHDRIHTTPDGYFYWNYLWDVLIARIGLEYRKRLRDQPELHSSRTVMIEFSRGREHGGYRKAFSHLTPEILARAVILYIQVSYEESVRKNRQRFNPNRPDSVLQHGLSDEKMERLYRETDWDDLTAGQNDFLWIMGYQVPYAVFNNEDDVTTAAGEKLGARLEQVLHTLWNKNQRRVGPAVTNG